MISDTASIPLRNLSCVFAAVFSIGMLITLPLYKFDMHKFIHSKLFIKIIMWWPIFGIFLAVLYMNYHIQLVICGALAYLAYRDVHENRAHVFSKTLVFSYYVAFVVCLCHLAMFGRYFSAISTDALIMICFASVVADVTAFFMGNYIGRHKLPESLNSNKSWEGVSGQILGALLGCILIQRFVHIQQPLLLFVPIGVGSIVGDLINSYVKRQCKIHEWSNAIPGHGGYLDRLSSLSGSLLLTFYWFVIFM